MSYLRYTTPRYPLILSGLGASAEADFMASAHASTSSEQSSSDSLVAYAKQSQQMRQYWNEIKKYGPKRMPKSFKDGASMAADGLYRYSKDYAKNWARNEIDSLASSYGFEGCVPDHLPHSSKEAFHMGADIAAAGACYSMGIEPKLGVTTVDAVWDGRISSEECEAIGAVAGAVAGAAVGQMFGIPAPIGAFIGGKVGSLVGKGIAKLFGLSSDARRKWLAEQRKIVKKLKAEADADCYAVRKAYWVMFDKLLVEIEAQWEYWELTVGAKFDLRWFDPTPGFYQWIQQQIKQYTPYIDGPYCQVQCDSTIIYQGEGPYLKTHTQAQLDALTKAKCPPKTTSVHDSVCAYGCAVEFGCLYPRFDSWKKSSLPKDKRLFGTTQRVVDAFLAHGFDWLPPPSGVKLAQIGPETIYASNPGQRNLVCDLPAATKKEIEHSKARDRWVTFMQTLIEFEVQRSNRLHSAQVRILNDLIKTASIASAQLEIARIVEKQKKEQVALVKRVAPKVITDSGRTRNQVVNTGALVGGSGLLLWSLL
jgi:hypothetical protein